MPPRLTDLAEAVSAARALVPPSGRRLLGVVGPPGAGKSMLAERLAAALGSVSAVVPLDGFHLPNAVLAERGLADVKGAPETFDRGGFVGLLQKLTARADGRYSEVLAPQFHRGSEASVEDEIVVAPQVRLVLVEGNYLLAWPEVHAILDEVWYLEPASERRRVEQLIARHVQFGRTPEQARAWVLRSDEANARFIAAGRSLADRVVTVW